MVVAGFDCLDNWAAERITHNEQKVHSLFLDQVQYINWVKVISDGRDADGVCVGESVEGHPMCSAVHKGCARQEFHPSARCLIGYLLKGVPFLRGVESAAT